jgi:hypothetical protein
MAALNEVYRDVARAQGVNYIDPASYRARLAAVRAGDGLHFNDRSQTFASIMARGISVAQGGPAAGEARPHSLGPAPGPTQVALGFDPSHERIYRPHERNSVLTQTEIGLHRAYSHPV